MTFGTHDSATGEKGYWLWRPFTWLCKTQTLSISEQLYNGCKYFDLRVKKTHRGFVCAHGLWTTKKTFEDILHDLEVEKMEGYYFGKVYVSVTYEGTLDESKYDEFINYVKSVIPQGLTLIFIAVKYAKLGKHKRGWKTLKTYNTRSLNGCYPCFDFSDWKSLFPIPILWRGKKMGDYSRTAINVVDFF